MQDQRYGTLHILTQSDVLRCVANCSTVIITLTYVCYKPLTLTQVLTRNAAIIVMIKLHS